MKTKVRVKRDELAKVVRMRLRKAENEHKRAREAHPAKMAAWKERVADQLEKEAAKARNGKNEWQYNRIQLPDRPTMPSEGRDLCNLRRMLKTLEIGAEDTIMLSQEDADWYFGPCKF